MIISSINQICSIDFWQGCNDFPLNNLQKKLIIWLISGSEKVSALFQFLLQYFIIYLLCIHYILVGVGRKYSTILFKLVIWRTYYLPQLSLQKKKFFKKYLIWKMLKFTLIIYLLYKRRDHRKCLDRLSSCCFCIVQCFSWNTIISLLPSLVS